jgi:hypothetical protein
MSSSQPQIRTQPTMRRLNINLPESVYDTLQRLAQQTNRTMTDIIRTALSLVKIALETDAKGNKLAVVSPDGKVLKEIVLSS